MQKGCLVQVAVISQSVSNDADSPSLLTLRCGIPGVFGCEETNDVKYTTYIFAYLSCMFRLPQSSHRQAAQKYKQGTTSIKLIVDASQAYSHQFQNLKRKFCNCNTIIYFNHKAFM